MDNISELHRAESELRTPDQHDAPFERFQPYHFSTRQLARLLLLRGEVLESRAGAGPFSDDLRAA
jgi:hypothetical protein